jgi:hypothetical protein
LAFCAKTRESWAGKRCQKSNPSEVNMKKKIGFTIVFFGKVRNKINRLTNICAD